MHNWLDATAARKALADLGVDNVGRLCEAIKEAGEDALRPSVLSKAYALMIGFGVGEQAAADAVDAIAAITVDGLKK